jgi:hypothetical protein
MKKKITLLPIMLYIASVIFPLSLARADSMSNANYIIDMGSFNATSGKASNSNYKVATTVGETGPGLYTGKNYKVKNGFEYIYPTSSAFSFSLSETLIDFGILSATNPVTRTTTLTVNNPSVAYKVIGYEDHPLLAGSGARINDATCDNGSCTEITAALWSNTLTYGFGFRCDNIAGTDCETGFKSSDDYKQFADISKKDSPQPVMTGMVSGGKRQSKVTYKVNISGTQQPGTYTNSITYIAIPSF